MTNVIMLCTDKKLLYWQRSGWPKTSWPDYIILVQHWQELLKYAAIANRLTLF